MRRSTLYSLIFIIILTAFAVWVDLPGSRNIFGRQAEVVEGLDLQGGLQVLLQARHVGGKAPTREQMEEVRQVVEQRVNSLGLTEPVVQLQGSDRIVVELPGVKDPEQAIRTFQGTGLLEFINAGDTPLQVGTLVNTTLGPAITNGNQNQNSTKNGTPTPGTTPTPESTPQANQTPVAANVTPTPEDPQFQQALQATPPEQLQRTYTAVITGNDIASARPDFDPTTGEPVVSFELKPEAAKKFADFTTQNVGKYLAIALDKKIISSPQIRDPITNGRGVITGVTREEARTLAIQIRSGSLSVPLDIISSNTVGATLGNDSVQRSIRAGLIGIGAVALFMILYYRLPGFVSVVALAIYAAVVFALFKLIPVTLTLAGIAGFVLSVGMAVDANVLIFARLKDELRRGRGLLQAIDVGFKNAWPSIRDSNISTLITCAILIWFGSRFGASVIKGFAITLAIGVIVSMFTAIFVTRTLLQVVLSMVHTRNLWIWGIGKNQLPEPEGRTLQPAKSSRTTQA